jgi:phosphate-selective porin OprO/OprP
MPLTLRLSAALIMSLIVPSFAFSQTTSASAQTPPAAPVTAGWQDGFFVQSADGNYRLLFGLVAQADGRFSLDDPKPITNTFAVRKFRPTFSGRVARYFDFKLMPDLGNGQTVVADAYFDIRFSPKFRIRSGKDKSPLGYEMLIGDAFVLFTERSLATNLVPNRDIGVQAQGDLNPKFYYAGGVFNGVPDGASSTTDADTNNGKDLIGRFVVQPFRTTGTPTSSLSGLGFQIGASTGKQSGALPVFRTSVGQTYFAYATGATADGLRTRVSPSVFYYYRSLGVFGEYVRSAQQVGRAGVSDSFTNTGWDVTMSYLLTGEPASSGITRPSKPFDPTTGAWGALQILTRYAVLDFDDAIFESGFAASGASEQATQFSVGLNWYPASVVKYYFSYERTAFEHGVSPDRPTENVILLRAQLGI